ncbi:hypothetical protein GF339_07500, partial [candidate division KSB3 bacterium]|nr:hypothetical protein [candidate division KSB3 bacterium]MBD3324415.1 hypothetical protein [candidate division KSB3 bacterium]
MMAAKQLPIPIDLKVLRVLAYRHKWLLVILTFLSFAFSAVITRSMINRYSASITIFVDPENVLGDITKGVAVSTSLRDQLPTLQHLVLSDDFIEPHVIQDLNLQLADVYVPPFRLTFMPAVIDSLEAFKDHVKRLFNFEIYTQTEDQRQYLERRELVQIVKAHLELRQSRGSLLSISYTGPSLQASQKIVEIVANQCKEFLLRNKNQETREAVRYIERQYEEANQKLNELEQELAQMRVEQFDKGPEAKIALLQQRQEALDALRVIQKDLEEIRQSKEDLLAQQNERREALLSGDPETIEKLAQIAQTQDYQLLETKRTQLAALLTVYTEEWPEVIKLREEIAALEKRLADNITRADDMAKEKILLADPIYQEYFRQLTQLKTNEDALKTRERNLRESIDIYETKIKEMPEIEKSFGAIQRQIDLATKRETARATMELEKTRGEMRIRTVSRSFPNKPVGIPPILIMTALSLLGPLTGAGIIFLLYYFNTSVKSPEDVQIEYNLPVLAIIPKIHFTRELRRYLRVWHVLT